MDFPSRKEPELQQLQSALEKALHENGWANELTTILDAIPTPVIIVHDSEGTHMTGNRAELKLR